MRPCTVRPPYLGNHRCLFLLSNSHGFPLPLPPLVQPWRMPFLRAYCRATRATCCLPPRPACWFRWPTSERDGGGRARTRRGCLGWPYLCSMARPLGGLPRAATTRPACRKPRSLETAALAAAPAGSLPGWTLWWDCLQPSAPPPPPPTRTACAAQRLACCRCGQCLENVWGMRSGWHTCREHELGCEDVPCLSLMPNPCLSLPLQALIAADARLDLAAAVDAAAAVQPIAVRELQGRALKRHRSPCLPACLQAVPGSWCLQLARAAGCLPARLHASPVSPPPPLCAGVGREPGGGARVY